MSPQELQEIEDFWREQYDKADEDVYCPVASNPCISFLSYSQGRGRPRRRYPRLVKLFVRGNHAYLVHDTPRGMLDRIAEEILANVRIPPDRTPYEEFLRRFNSAAVPYQRP